MMDKETLADRIKREYENPKINVPDWLMKREYQLIELSKEDKKLLRDELIKKFLGKESKEYLVEYLMYKFACDEKRYRKLCELYTYCKGLEYALNNREG